MQEEGMAERIMPSTGHRIKIPSHRLKNWPVLGQVEFAVDTKVIWNASVSNLVVRR